MRPLRLFRRGAVLPLCLRGLVDRGRAQVLSLPPLLAPLPLLLVRVLEAVFCLQLMLFCLQPLRQQRLPSLFGAWWYARRRWHAAGPLAQAAAE